VEPSLAFGKRVIPWEVEEPMSLTPSCREIIVGTILGDGCLERNGKNVRLRVDHGHHQQALVEWKFQQLAELAPSRPKRVEVFDRRTNQTYVHYRFASRTTEELNEYFDLFYGTGVKCIPPNIASYLSSALSIAVWYMDDGGRRADCRSGYFNTQAYRVGEIESLRQCLLRNFDLLTTTHFAAGRPRIYVAKAHFQRLCDLIRPHVILAMRYKLL
jgi:hypothetical protein